MSRGVKSRGAFKRRWRDEKGSGEQPTWEARSKQGEMGDEVRAKSQRGAFKERWRDEQGQRAAYEGD